MISTFTAVIDSNVFYGARLRSLILYLAQTGLFRARWTDEIHNEWISNLLAKRTDLNAADLERTKADMNGAVLDCLVTDYQDLISALTLPDPDDRHVLAAAIKCGANVIVTFNENDFPEDIVGKYGIHIKHPDDFVLDLLGVDDETCLDQITQDIAHYKTPKLTVEDYINSLEKAGIARTAAFLRDIKIVF